MTNENGLDQVEAGIREWRKTRADAEAAIEKAHVAEQDATFVRGQLEVLQQQKKTDDAKIRALEGHVQEMELYTNAMVEAILGIVERRKAGMFRRAGSIENRETRIAAARSGDNGAGGSPDQNDRANEERPARRSVDMGQLERDLTDIPKLLLRGASED